MHLTGCRNFLSILALTVVITTPLSVYAQVPGIINYQGRLVDNGTNFTGTGQFKFALVNTGATTNYWANDGTAVGQPTVAVSLTVTKGLYSVLLGNTTISNITAAIPAGVFTNSTVLLRVWFNDGVSGFQQLSPDQRIGAVGYALVAATVPNGAIGSAQLASNAVTTANITPGAVTATQLASNTITAANIASNTITAAQIASGYGLVPSGSSVLSLTAANPTLIADGFAPVLIYPWIEATNAAPWSGRSAFQAVAFNSQMWVMGGVNAVGPFSDVWSSSNGLTWVEATAAASWVPRYFFGSVAFNGRLWVMGGIDQHNTLYNDVWSSSNGVSWTEVTNAAPWSARWGLAAVTNNGQIWVMGGQTQDSPFPIVNNDVWSSSNGVTWTEVTSSAPWGGRTQFGTVALNGQLWVMGGENNTGGYLNDVWSSSNGVTWVEATNSAPWGARQAFGAMALSGQLWVMGGEGNTYLNDVWSSSNGVNWTEWSSSASWTGRYAFGAVPLNSQLWIMGGSDSNSAALNDVWSSQLTTNSMGGYFLYQKQ
jgi:Kelch motif protein